MSDRETERQALKRRSHELSILNDVARALNASVDLPTLLARALKKVTELLGMSTGWVFLFDETSGRRGVERKVPRPGPHPRPLSHHPFPPPWERGENTSFQAPSSPRVGVWGGGRGGPGW